MDAADPTPSDREAGDAARLAGAERVLVAERVRAAAQVAALASDFDSVVESCEQDAYDDEHDPEGHTIAFERQQVAALLRDARSHLDDLDLALARVVAGTYGICEHCGRSIAAERLAARPAARRCVACAT